MKGFDLKPMADYNSLLRLPWGVEFAEVWQAKRGHGILVRCIEKKNSIVWCIMFAATSRSLISERWIWRILWRKGLAF